MIWKLIKLIIRNSLNLLRRKSKKDSGEEERDVRKILIGNNIRHQKDKSKYLIIMIEYILMN